MKRILPLGLALFFCGCNAAAGNYLIEPAALLVPTPTPAPQPLSPTGEALSVSPAAELQPLSPTAVAASLPAPQRVFLVPFKDKRKSPYIYKGRAEYENVMLDASGRTTLAKSWQSLPMGDLSFLWHRQLAVELAKAGYDVSASAEPMEGEAALKAAKEAGAGLLLQGDLRKMGITKHGADLLFGTNYSGTNYTFYSTNEIKLKSVDSAAEKAKSTIDFEEVFLNEEHLGAADRGTFPVYFVMGLPHAARGVADDSALRKAVGLPTCTATPTVTPTPFPTKRGSPMPTSIAAPAGPTPTATPDNMPYWYNPKTGKRVDPNWNFDPADGTPRKDFILRAR
jgi:hypothetical protein